MSWLLFFYSALGIPYLVPRIGLANMPHLLCFIVQLESEKGHLSGCLEDAQQQLEKYRMEPGGEQRLAVARLLGPIRALIALHGEDINAECNENVSTGDK